jgi:hypothetical protein
MDCGYMGRLYGLVQHCRTKHNILSVHNISAVPNDGLHTIVPIFDKLVDVQDSKHNAAATVIQRYWRIVYGKAHPQ